MSSGSNRTINHNAAGGPEGAGMKSATAKRTAATVVETTFSEVLHGAAKIGFMAVVTKD